MKYKKLPIKKSVSDIHNTIIEFFRNNPYPDDTVIHNLAQLLRQDPDNFEGHIYMILSSIINEGKSVHYDGEYNPEELAEGIKIELEHTTDINLSEKIAKDHLAEIPDYYTRLKKMEEEAKAEGMLREIPNS